MGDHHNGLHAFTEMANIAEQICKKVGIPVEVKDFGVGGAGV